MEAHESPKKTQKPHHNAIPHCHLLPPGPSCMMGVDIRSSLWLDMGTRQKGFFTKRTKRGKCGKCCLEDQPVGGGGWSQTGGEPGQTAGEIGEG